MTDISKYKNICVPLDTYNTLKKQSTEIIDGVNISLSQTVQHNAFLAEQYLNGEPVTADKINLAWNMAKAKRSAARRKTKPDEYSGHKLHLVRKLPEPKYVGTATTKDEIKSRNRIIFENRVVANNLTLQQLGTMYNISRERVRQIQDHEVSIKKLKQQTKETNANTN